MARRRRLEPPDSEDLAAIRAEAATDGLPRPAVDMLSAPPIAKVASDAAAAQRREIDRLRDEASTLREAARRLADAEESGLVIREIPLEAIDVDYLARDRTPRPRDDETWRALRQSIELHGQRTPVEIAALGAEARRPYGLISGYRRYGVLQRLAQETGEARWGVVRAVIRTPRSLGSAFVAMVEENEMREALTYYDRGQVCVRAVEQGAFPTIDAALDALFAGASAAKKSKIRSFVTIVEEIGDLLQRPERIGERLGLRLARALREGRGGAVRRLLGEEIDQRRDAGQEQAALAAFLSAGGGSRPQDDPPGAQRVRRVEDGLVAIRRGRGRTTIEVRGPALSDAALERLLDAIAAAVAGRA